MEEFKYLKVRDVKSPERGTPLSAGIDFYVPNDLPCMYIRSGTDVLIPSGIKACIPHGYMLIGHDKSGVVSTSFARERIGLSVKYHHDAILKVGAKVIDEDYQGEIHIHLINLGPKPMWIRPGQKIAQFILVPISYAMPQEVSSLEELYSEQSARGEGGFGSTNK